MPSHSVTLRASGCPPVSDSKVAQEGKSQRHPRFTQGHTFRLERGGFVLRAGRSAGALSFRNVVVRAPNGSYPRNR